MPAVLSRWLFTQTDSHGWRVWVHGVDLGVVATELAAAKHAAACLGVSLQEIQREGRPGMTHKSDYTGVGWHVGRVGWVAKARGATLGIYASQGWAAKAVAKHLNCHVRDLQKSELTEGALPVSLYKHVTWHRGKKAFIIQYECKTIGGLHRTDRSAAEWLACFLHLPVQSLKRGRLRPTAQQLLVPRFVALHSICHDMVPSDLDDLVQRWPVETAAYVHCPALLVFSIMGKYGPYRDAQHAAAMEVEEVASGPSFDADFANDVLEGTARRVESLVDQGSLSAWHQSVGRNVSHHSGWLPFFQRCGLLRRWAGKGARGRDRALRLGSQGMLYIFKRWTARSHQLLLKLHSLGRLLMGAQAPKSLDQWCEQHVQLSSRIARLCLPVPGLGMVSKRRGLTTKKRKVKTVKKSKTSIRSSRQVEDGPLTYTINWLVRAVLIGHMREAGIEWLRPGSSTVAQLAHAFPDQCRWVGRACRAMSLLPSSLVTEFAAALQYKGPLEYMTMRMCLYGGTYLSSIDPVWLRAQCRSLRSIATDHFRVHGVNVHPEQLVRLGRATM